MSLKKIFFFAILFIFFISSQKSFSWGFYGHQRINRLAVFCLPPEMIPFYKRNIFFLTENAVNPDKRRYAISGEAPRHFIDMENYQPSSVDVIPKYWNEAVEKYTIDSMMAFGIVPWHIVQVKFQLQKAFEQKDVFKILKLSADIGHYIADSNVPLHTTVNYNGYLTNQAGIHAFWESRLVELFSDNYDFFVGQATYIKDPQASAWKAVITAHNALDSVLIFEKKLSKSFPEDKKYSFEERNGLTVKVYSKAYSAAYHKMLGGQVERQMRNSIKMISDFWYTCWVDAGQPDLNFLINYQFNDIEKKIIEEEIKPEGKKNIKLRDHEIAFIYENNNCSGSCCQTFAIVTPAQIRRRALKISK